MSGPPDTVASADRVESLSALFHPRSVVVVGASDNPERIGGRLLRYLIEARFEGEIHPVNPNRATVQGLRAVPSVLDLEQDRDVALLAVSADMVRETLEQCAARGVKAAVVLAAGFSEVGGEGDRAQQEITEFAREAGIRLLGPNCLGVLNSAIGYYGTFSNALGRGLPVPGPVGICSQSGAYGGHLLYLARRRGLGVTYWITTGNEADIDVADAIAWMAQRPEVKVVAAYLEGVKDGARLTEALRIAYETRTAVVVTKVGASEAGARAASSHTAALAGSDAAYDAVFRQFGALRARGAEELLDFAYACAQRKPISGNRLGIITISGGAGVQACDAAARHGLTVPPLPAEAQAQLRSLLPFAGVTNPIDVTAQVLQQIDVLATALKLARRGPTFDALLTFMTTTPLHPAFTEPLREAILRGTAGAGEQPLALCMIADDDVVRDYESRGFLVFEDLDRAVAALAALFRLGQAWERRPPELATSGLRAAALPAGPLSERESKELLAAAGVPVLAERVAADPNEAVIAAQDLGYPVALKILSSDIPHKTEIGGVALDVADAAAVRTETARILTAAAEKVPRARIDGVLVAPMAPPGVEIIVGVDRDPTFGPLLMVGTGGIFVEIYRDVSFRLAPVDEVEAREMVDELQGAALLRGARGRPPADVEALCSAIAAISRFAAGHGSELRSLDVNPLLVLPAGQGVAALDAAITFAAPEIQAERS
jgi:acetate---CoA ligase (ADP-forming)